MAYKLEPGTFKHEELPDASTYIRLLEVLSVERSRAVPVHCRLTTWPKASAPDYTAISYTWGDSSAVTTILVNGEGMQVRRNCEDVLTQPCRNKGGYFWIDAICINQADNDEKSFQVASMGEVFEDASQTLACVGRQEKDSRFLFKNLQRHQYWWERLGFNGLGPPGKHHDRARLWRKALPESTMKRLFEALYMFLKRPYFQRVWIYQELFFGKDI